MQRGIVLTGRGIEVDARCGYDPTSALCAIRRCCVGNTQFTHIRRVITAGIVIKNALFACAKAENYAAVPWLTYTDPRLANVGLSEAAAARAPWCDVKCSRPLSKRTDRARTETPHRWLLLKVVLAARVGSLGPDGRGPCGE